MSVLIGAGVVAVVAAGYIGRKGWLAFHRAVGITPGTLKYVEPSQLPPPPMLQLTLTEDQIQGLPPVVVQQLLRIDSKADIFKQWRNEAIAEGQTPTASEDEFMVSKLLQTRLPELVNSYQRIARHEDRLQQAAARGSNFANDLDNTHLKNDNYHSVYNNEAIRGSKEQALALLLELLASIESKLDHLLQGCENEALQDMQVMRLYLEQRK